ncbi:MAG TPA: hypothetical protein VFI47_16200 [Acidimicrobiales bacterium]|nr:hypothetical protein [Acidimicrobiales bacterium]
MAGHWSAESVHLVERLVVAPVAGVFFPTFTEVSPDEPGVVAAGDQIGFVVHCGDKQIVDSPFTGRLLGLLAHPGERVRPEQPLAWLTTADDW